MMVVGAVYVMGAQGVDLRGGRIGVVHLLIP